MSVLRFARSAEADLNDIAFYSLRTSGRDQAGTYLRNLRLCCERLADSPLLGRSCEAPHSQLRRFEHGSHTIFYQEKRAGILVIRILHQRMLPERQLH